MISLISVIRCNDGSESYSKSVTVVSKLETLMQEQAPPPSHSGTRGMYRDFNITMQYRMEGGLSAFRIVEGAASGGSQGSWDATRIWLV